MDRERAAHWFYYWSSGIIDIIQGVFILLTLGIFKVSWSFRYAIYWAKINMKLSADKRSISERKQ